MKSESSALEHNYIKHFKNNDNNNNDTNINDDTYDDKIRGKINNIWMILSRLGNIVDISGSEELQKWPPPSLESYICKCYLWKKT